MKIIDDKMPSRRIYKIWMEKYGFGGKAPDNLLMSAIIDYLDEEYKKERLTQGKKDL